MSRLHRILNKLARIAENVPYMTHSHGAVLLKNGVPLAYGWNNIRGESTIHAERHVLEQYIRSTSYSFKEGLFEQCSLRA